MLKSQRLYSRVSTTLRTRRWLPSSLSLMISALRLHSLRELINVASSMAIGTAGPRIFLENLLLSIGNLEERKRGRSWLLPTLKSSVTIIDMEYPP